MQSRHLKNMLAEYDVMQRFYSDLPRKVVERYGDARGGTMDSLMLGDIYQLYKAATEIPHFGRYVEIGSYLGASALIVNEARNNLHGFGMTAVDPCLIASEKQLRENLAMVDTTLLMDYSGAVYNHFEDNCIDLLFIDGDHSYEGVKADILNYWPKVKPGGVILGHDFCLSSEGPGAVRAFLELLPNYDLTRLGMSTMVKVQKDARYEAL